MAFQDTAYQINDLKGRLRVLENQLRSQAPQTAKASPIAPLTNATSTGTTVAGVGMSTDAFSRALATGIQSGLSSVESIQDVLVTSAPIVFNFGGGATQTIHTTNYLRPDPIVGDTYRMLASGYLQNNDIGAQTFQFKFQVGSGTTLQISQFVVAAASDQIWWLHLTFIVTTAGTSGIYSISSLQTASLDQPGLPLSGTVVGVQDILVRSGVSANFVAPTVVLSCTNIGGANANTNVALYSYSLERMGAGFASKV